MKTKCQSVIHAACRSFGGVVCAGLVNLIAYSAEAQNLYVSDFGTTMIYEFTPNGVQSIFASSGVHNPAGIAFNSAGNLFEADREFNNVNEFTPSGVRTVFGVVSSQPNGLAFNSAG